MNHILHQLFWYHRHRDMRKLHSARGHNRLNIFSNVPQATPVRVVVPSQTITLGRILVWSCVRIHKGIHPFRPDWNVWPRNHKYRETSTITQQVFVACPGLDQRLRANAHAIPQKMVVDDQSKGRNQWKLVYAEDQDLTAAVNLAKVMVCLTQHRRSIRSLRHQSQSHNKKAVGNILIQETCHRLIRLHHAYYNPELHQVRLPSVLEANDGNERNSY